MSTVGLGLLDDRFGLVQTGEATTQAGPTKLTASDGDADDRFGWDVDIDGDTAVVGGRNDEDPNGSGAGSAYVYVWSGGSWSQQAKLDAGDGDDDDHFGWSVAIAGDTVVVGAPDDEDPNGTGSGAAYVYTRSGNNWSQQAKLTASDGDADDRFGWDVDIDADTAVVAARDDHVSDGQGGSVRAGSTYVFNRTSSSWSQDAKLVVSDDPNNDLASSVAISGDTVVVGDSGDAQDGDVSGAAYVFTRSSSGWSQPTMLNPGDNDRDDHFGDSVDIDGDTVVVGAPGDEDPNGEFAGSAYVFDRSSGSWSQQAKLAASDGVSGDQFGSGVAVNGDTVVAGPGDTDDSSGASAYVYSRSSGNWSEDRKLEASNGDQGDGFGESIAMDGGSVIVGAADDADPNGTDAGSAYVFELLQLPPDLFEVPPNPPFYDVPLLIDILELLQEEDEEEEEGYEVYELDWDDDGEFEEETETPEVVHTFEEPGAQTVRIRLTPEEGEPMVKSLTFVVQVRVDIDIKPGDDENVINPRSRGMIPVAIQGTEPLDPSQIIPWSVRFGDPDDVGYCESAMPKGGTAPAHEDGHLEDIDDDEDEDLLLHFPVRDADFDPEDTEGKLVALTREGTPLVGFDSVRFPGK